MFVSRYYECIEKIRVLLARFGAGRHRISNGTRGFYIFLICIVVNIPGLAQSEPCIAAGSTVIEAKKEYTSQCSLERRDCDFVNGTWYCASATIQPSVIASFVQHSRHSEKLSCIDADGDGWGWNGQASCRMHKDESSGGGGNKNDSRIESGDNSEIAPAVVVKNDTGTCVDTDGDGWGWDGSTSCKMKNLPLNLPLNLDTNLSHGSQQQIDLYQASVVPVSSGRSSVPGNCEKIASGNYHITELVTDLFLTAGQSNATGDQTVYNPRRYTDDRVNGRVIVWTENNKWEVANPATQTWHNGKYPGGYRVFNHPAFQIGRAIAELDECRVVAFIATAAAGMPIDHWREDRDSHYSKITEKVVAAINALPHKDKVDMIWWMQGEADNDQIVNRYFSKLTHLIKLFRNESWFSSNGYFLANETGWFSYANEAIRMLRQDGDPFSDFSSGEDSAFNSFPSRPNEVERKVHFNEVSLRKIGNLVAAKYLYQYLVLKGG